MIRRNHKSITQMLFLLEWSRTILSLPKVQH